VLIFMDESGDDGIKLDAGSSPRFLFAAVGFAVQEDADACRAAVADFRAARGLPANFEFRHASTPPNLLRELAVALSLAPFEAMVAAIDKTEFPDSRFRHPVQAAALRMFGDRLRKAKVYADECGGKNSVIATRTALRSLLGRTGDGVPRIAHFVACKSHVESLVQIADLVAGVSAEAMRGSPALLKSLGERVRLEMKTPADL
jgi:hypothetical protein